MSEVEYDKSLTSFFVALAKQVVNFFMLSAIFDSFIFSMSSICFLQFLARVGPFVDHS